MAITKIEIEHFDKEYLIFVISRLTGLPPGTGPSYRIHRYAIKTEDAKKLIRFLLEDDDENT